MRFIHSTIIVSSLFLSATCALFAQPAAALSKHVVAAGALNASGGGIALQSTIGQPAIGITTGQSFTAYEGFWYVPGEGTTSVPGDYVSLPRVLEIASYPNPFSSAVTIDLSVVPSSAVHIFIYDITGATVFGSYRESDGSGSLRAVWEGRNLIGDPVAAGMYFISANVESRDGTAAQRATVPIVRLRK